MKQQKKHWRPNKKKTTKNQMSTMSRLKPQGCVEQIKQVSFPLDPEEDTVTFMFCIIMMEMGSW